jgi:hypothetical protein
MNEKKFLMRYFFLLILCKTGQGVEDEYHWKIQSNSKHFLIKSHYIDSKLY